ncbi:MAG: hypothetical protein HYY04_06660 [Chloroflexi bacterium]|nr:hypothetical protein [Chloroflexota bacterium]
MLRFIAGFIVGALAATWYQQNQAELDVDRRFAEMQDRANAVLNESRRILEETRRELASALEAGRVSIQSKAERLRQSAETGESQPGGETPQS